MPEVDDADLSQRALVTGKPAQDVLAWLVAGTRLETDAMNWLTALATAQESDSGGAAMSTGPTVIVNRIEAPPSLPAAEPDQEPAADVRMLPFATAMAATALAG